MFVSFLHSVLLLGEKGASPSILFVFPKVFSASKTLLGQIQSCALYQTLEKWRSEEMTPCLRALNALPEDMGSIPNATWQLTTACNSKILYLHTAIHSGKTPMHINKIKFVSLSFFIHSKAILSKDLFSVSTPPSSYFPQTCNIFLINTQHLMSV